MGQYSPYFSLAAESVPNSLPEGCRIIFVQYLARHGARFPTKTNGENYRKLIDRIKGTSLEGKYSFLREYEYNLGTEELTNMGRKELFNSGIQFYRRYASLIESNEAHVIAPFVRSSDSQRVIESADKFLDGLQRARLDSEGADKRKEWRKTPKVDVILGEYEGFNNSLNHGVCPNFEKNKLSDQELEEFTSTFVPAISKRLHQDGLGDLSTSATTNFMDMCPFHTVAFNEDPTNLTLSPFCDLFTPEEWTSYDYLQSLKKYYGYGGGNPLGPAQGIGFANELIARLTNTSVHDHTSTNHTLDSNPATFPLIDTAIYADFTHDNGLIPIYFALGLYDGTKPLPKSHKQSTKETNGFSSAWTVPFAARASVEAMSCAGEPEPLVRVLVNDRVVPPHGCEPDSLGRCTLDNFVWALGFARGGGNWGSCFD